MKTTNVGLQLHAGVALPDRPRRVKALSDLARLARGVYCTIIIINDTNLINFYSFHFGYQCVIKRAWFF